MPTKANGTIGVLTAGGDCPGLNAAIRGVSKAAMHYGFKVIGIRDGFRGLVENRTLVLDNALVSGVLTQGGTFLGSSRDKPHKMQRGDKTVDLTPRCARTASWASIAWSASAAMARRRPRIGCKSTGST